MGVIQVIVLISLAVVLGQAFPQKDSTPASEGNPPAAQTPVIDEKEDNAEPEQKAPSRLARAADPQNHAVNYIRPDDRFPTVA